MKGEVVIQRKKMKNIILKITPEGKILVSAPKKVSKKIIDEFIEKNRKWIEEKLEKIVDKSFKNGENIEYLGKNYKICIEKFSKEKIGIEDEKLLIKTKFFDDEEKIKNLIEKWYREKSLELYKKLVEKFSTLTELKVEKIKVRKMKNKWGVCRFLKKEITFNLELIKKPIEAIEYVVLHEIAHIKIPNHKKEFWDFLEKYMNDWKERKGKL